MNRIKKKNMNGISIDRQFNHNNIYVPVSDYTRCFGNTENTNDDMNNHNSSHSFFNDYGNDLSEKTNIRTNENNSSIKNNSVKAENTKTVSTTITDDVCVSISGVYYDIPNHIFQQLDRLPWKWVDNDLVEIQNTSTEENKNKNKNKCRYQLDTATTLFDIILSYIQYNTIPDICSKENKLTKGDYEELALMVTMLDLVELKEHLDKQRSKSNNNINRIGAKKLLSYGVTVRNNIKYHKKKKQQEQIDKEKKIQDELFQVQQLSSLDSSSSVVLYPPIASLSLYDPKLGGKKKYTSMNDYNSSNHDDTNITGCNNNTSNNSHRRSSFRIPSLSRSATAIATATTTITAISSLTPRRHSISINNNNNNNNNNNTDSIGKRRDTYDMTIKTVATSNDTYHNNQKMNSIDSTTNELSLSLSTSSSHGMNTRSNHCLIPSITTSTKGYIISTRTSTDAYHHRHFNLSKSNSTSYLFQSVRNVTKSKKKNCTSCKASSSSEPGTNMSHFDFCNKYGVVE